MAEFREQDLTSLLYLAQALPTLRRRSDEAASLVEAAIVECLISMSGGRRAGREPTDFAALLRYAAADIEAIAPTGALLIERAVGRLGDRGREAAGEPSFTH